jgi:hypothetical protein
MASIFSPPRATRLVSRDLRPTPCTPPAACVELSPSITAGSVASLPQRSQPRTRFQSAVISYRLSHLTPGITRRPERLREDNKHRVGGRVHAVVGRGVRKSYYSA